MGWKIKVRPGKGRTNDTRNLLPVNRTNFKTNSWGETFSLLLGWDSVAVLKKACNAVCFEASPQRCLWSVAMGGKEMDGPQTKNMCYEFIQAFLKCYSLSLQCLSLTDSTYRIGPGFAMYSSCYHFAKRTIYTITNLCHASCKAVDDGNFIQTFMFPRGWILLTLLIPGLHL